jgi:23S rRNA pseudouridine1911/1915/1917 synthase
MNAGFSYREIVGSEGAGRTLLDHLSGRHPHSSAGEWRERIGAGRVLVDGMPSTAAAVLRAGQAVVWHRPPWAEPEAPLAWALLHRDDDLLAAAKPAGLPTMPGGGFLEHTLLALVRRRFPEASPVHRLDRGASGLVLFARTARAAERLAADFRAGLVVKEYRALVRGAPAHDRLAITTPIVRVAHPRLGFVYEAAAAARGPGDAPGAGGAAPGVVRPIRTARTEIGVLERRAGATLLAVRPITGRPHQIRIHLAAAGWPLVGEPLYVTGGTVRADAESCGAGGYLLHAWRLVVDHPATRRPLAIECAPPPGLRSPAGTARHAGACLTARRRAAL